MADRFDFDIRAFNHVIYKVSRNFHGYAPGACKTNLLSIYAIPEANMVIHR